MKTNIPPAQNQHALPESTPFIVGDTPGSIPDVPADILPSFEDVDANRDLLATLSIDQLRELAARLGVREVGSITENDELIQEIEKRLSKA